MKASSWRPWLACVVLIAGHLGLAVAAAPPPVTDALPAARLAGQGQMRWFGFKVYAADLWVSGTESMTVERLNQSPFALELKYATDLDGSAIAERSAQEIARLGFGDPARRNRWLTAMKRLFPNVSRGDRITGIHAPGRGARFFYNDRPLGAIDDPDFGPAFFGIWLDRRTVAPELRAALLRDLTRSAIKP